MLELNLLCHANLFLLNKIFFLFSPRIFVSFEKFLAPQIKIMQTQYLFVECHVGMLG